jgi:hypothetical protein
MFPFVWVGAAFAAGFLAVAMLVFAALARLLRVPEEGQGSIVPGLVAGVRDWTSSRTAALRSVVSPQGSSPMVEDAPGLAAPVERLAARVRRTRR